tara:strand:- start:435 stop:614 length:180 start_codon:yes stop_codon:yes gene_type:complete
MKMIDQKLDQWIHNSIIREEIRAIIVEHVISEKAEGFKAGWIKGQRVNFTVEKLINNNK